MRNQVKLGYGLLKPLWLTDVFVDELPSYPLLYDGGWYFAITPPSDGGVQGAVGELTKVAPSDDRWVFHPLSDELLRYLRFMGVRHIITYDNGVRYILTPKEHPLPNRYFTGKPLKYGVVVRWFDGGVR